MATPTKRSAGPQDEQTHGLDSSPPKRYKAASSEIYSTGTSPHTSFTTPETTPPSSPPISFPLLSKIPRVRQRAAPTSVAAPKQPNFRQSILSSKLSPLENWKRVANQIRDDLYAYTNIEDDQTRLLFIKPGQGDEAICVTFHTVRDTELGSTYHYEALSYHWGEGEPDNSIIVQPDLNSAPIKKVEDAVFKAVAQHAAKSSRTDLEGTRRLTVRPSLYQALKSLRDKEEPVPLWADALCINQANHVEKETQVLKMADIYHKADSVCVWLGAGDSTSAEGMNFIKRILDLDKFDELLGDNYVSNWSSLYELLKYSWFSRRWVIQELALARAATVHCGTVTIHWDDFKEAISIFHQYFSIIRPKLKDPQLSIDIVGELEPLGAKALVDISTSIFQKTPEGNSESTRGLELLVSSLPGFDTSDPRDTVHALLNIAKEKWYNNSDDIKAPPVPDYTLDLYEVYRNFVKWAIETSDSLDIICRYWALPEKASIPPEVTTVPRLVTLPSWIGIVDESPFGKGPEIFIGRRAGDSLVGLPGKNSYNASGKRRPNVRFGSYVPLDPNKLDMSLYATGLLIGKIDWASDPIPDGVIPRLCLEKAGWRHAEEDEGSKVPDKLWRTLVADRGRRGDPTPAWYQRACLHCLLSRTPNGHINTKELLKTNEVKGQQSLIQSYIERVQAVTWNRRFFTVVSSDDDDTELFGLGPPAMQSGDIVTILYGCSVPVILRPSRGPLPGYDGEQHWYKFVGEAYIHGMMDGEVLLNHKGKNEFRIW